MRVGGNTERGGVRDATRATDALSPARWISGLVGIPEYGMVQAPQMPTELGSRDRHFPNRPIGRSGATATGPQAEICRRYGDGASVPLERWGARSPRPDHESCRGVPLPSTTGRCLGW